MPRARRPDPPDDVDRLYQVPLAEFTSARNDLAKRAGAEGAAIRRLPKPNVAAWAVNQLYWRRRDAWDRLMEAARNVRAAHEKRLSGKGGDVESSEAEHRSAVRASADEVRELLREAGEVASAATLSSVVETLQALPGTEPPGRLTRPLKPLGLEALAGLLSFGRSRPRAVEPPSTSPEQTGVPPPASKAVAAREARAARRAAEAEKREAARLEAAIREARTAERRAAEDLNRARRSLARAERERAHLAERLQFLERQVTQATSEVRAHETRAAEATRTRTVLEQRRR
jgi:hypothetical protein